MRFLLPVRQLALLFVIVLFSTGCQMLTPPAPAQPPATPVVPVQTQPSSGEVSPTAPANTPTVLPPAAEPAVQGYLVFDQEQKVAHAFRPDGSELFSAPTPGLDYIQPALVTASSSAVYYRSAAENKIMRASPTSAEVVNIHGQDFLSIRISADEKWLAWSSFENQGSASVLRIARPDGSDAREIARLEVNPPGTAGYEAIEWTRDGKLLYHRTPVGLGGYILFGGYRGLYSFDPVSGATVNYVSPDEMFGLCLDTYQLDLKKVAFHCDQQGQAISILDLESKAKVSVAPIPDYPVTGNARFSPSGKWLAYSVARGNPDDEAGQIMLLDTGLSSAPVPLASVEKNGYVKAQGWLDENTLLFSRIENGVETIWTVQRDDSNARQVAAGQFAAWIP